MILTGAGGKSGVWFLFWVSAWLLTVLTFIATAAASVKCIDMYVILICRMLSWIADDISDGTICTVYREC